MSYRVLALAFVIGCGTPAPPEWKPPAVAEHHDEPVFYHGVPGADRLDIRLGINFMKDHPLEGIVKDCQLGYEGKWVTYIVYRDVALSPPHALRLLTQDLVLATNTALLLSDHDENILRINVADDHFNWLAGTNPDGEVVVKGETD